MPTFASSCGFVKLYRFFALTLRSLYKSQIFLTNLFENWQLNGFLVLLQVWQYN